MPAANKIYIQVDLESKDAEKAVDEVNKKIKEIGETTEKTSVKASGGVKRITASVEQSAGSMDKLAQAISALGLAEMGRQIFSVGDSLERIRLGFSHLDGGVALFQQIRDLSFDTGMGFQELAQGAQDLVAAGTAPALVARNMKILADQAALAGKTVQTVLNITEKMRLVGAKGFISGEDVGVFAQGNVRLMELIKQRLGMSQQALQQSMTKLYAPEVMRVALEESKRLSEGEAGRRTQESAGAALGQLKNKADELARSLVHALTPALVELVKGLEPVVKYVSDAVLWFDRLPPKVKTAAVAFGILAASLQAVSTAIGFLKLLPGGISLITGLGGAAATAWPAIKMMATTIGAATYGLGAMEIAAQALKVGLAGLLPLMPQIAIGAGLLAVALVAYGKFIGEPQDAARVEAINSALRERSNLMKQASQMEGVLAEMRVKVAEPPEEIFKVDTEDIESIRKANAALNQYIATMEEATEKRRSLMEEDEAKAQRARDYGAKLLADARRDQLKINQETIAALAVAWDEHFKNTKDSAQGTADAIVALEESMTTEVLKQIQMIKDARHKADLELLTMARKNAIARMEGIPDSTYAAQRQLAMRGFDQRELEIEQTRTENVHKYNEEIDKQLKGVDDVYQKEVSKLWELRKQGHISKEEEARDSVRAAKVAEDAYRNLEEQRSKFAVIENQKADAQIAEARIAMEKSINAAIFAMEKEQREAAAEARIDEINGVRDYQIAVATAVEAYTKEQKLAQIETVKDAQLTALDAVRREEMKNIELAREQFRLVLQAGVDTKIISPGQMTERLNEYDQNMRQKLGAIDARYQRDAQMQRIEAWRAGNQVIIDEQRQVYESIAGVMGDLFDAFLDKNKSVWSAIGDMIKRTLLGAIKSVITSRLAAALTSILGYGHVSFATGPLGQQIPVMGGGGYVPVTAGGVGPSAAAAYSAPNWTARMVSNTLGLLSREIRSAPAGGSSQGGADRMMDDSGPVTDVTTGGGGGVSRFSAQWGRIKDSFNIGKPMMVNGELKSWSQLTRGQRASAILNSEGFSTLATSVGTPLFMGSLGKRGVGAGLMGIAGGALAGAGIARMFGADPISGAVAGAGMGLFAAGYKRRGVSGLGMTTVGGMMTGLAIGTMIMPGLGSLIGAAIGAGVGLTVGIVNLFRKTKEQEARQLIRQTYGIDISDQNILSQVVEVAKQRFGGDVRMAVHSTEVQEMVRIYTMMTGQNANLPRPMYSATFAQSAAGGVQLQPVYSGGRMLANPYTGTTTAQVANALEYSQAPVFMQLNPAQASSLFAGQVVQVMGDNPGAVGAANTTAARSGQGRTAQSSALLEPATVMA